MTLLDDRGSAADSEWADRRRASTGPHLSWASSHPFSPRPLRPVGAEDVGVEVAGERWLDQARSYARSAALLDLLVAAGVALVTLVALSAVTAAGMVWGGATAAVFVAAIALCKGYDRRFLGAGSEEFQIILRAGGTAAAILALVAVVFELNVPRILVFGVLSAAVVAVAIGRHALRRRLHRQRRAGRSMLRTLVVGDAASVAQIVPGLLAAPHLGYRIVGLCLPAVTDAPPPLGVPLLGAFADIPQTAYDSAADVVIVAGGELSGEPLRRLSWALGWVGARLVVAPGLVEVLGPRVSLRPTAGLSLLEVETTMPRRRLVAKTVLDRSLGAVLLLLAAPVIALAAVAIRVTSPGPAFYSQSRIGVDGRPFTMWKLRSMYVDADARRAEILDLNDRDGLMFKMRDDPRVTRVGKFLRRSSLDELPQLFNVVAGDMSLVGPRPPLPEEVDGYRDRVMRRLHVRPGLTGLWQVSGRASLSWDESIQLDLRYVDNWSIAMDLMILWKTGRAVLGGSGAY